MEFLGIDLRDDTKDALAFQHQFKIAYPSIADTQATLAVDYRIPSAPALVFLIAQGKAADVVLGALGTMSVADFDTEITTLLGPQVRARRVAADANERRDPPYPSTAGGASDSHRAGCADCTARLAATT